MFTITYEQKSIIRKGENSPKSNKNQVSTTTLNNKKPQIITRSVDAVSKNHISSLCISKNLFQSKSSHNSLNTDGGCDSSNKNINRISSNINKAISNPTKTVKEFCDKLSQK
jgi:hypothetical protein